MLATINIVGKIQVNDDESGTRRTTYLHFARRGGTWECTGIETQCTGIETDGRTTPPPPCFSPNAEVFDALERGLARLLRYEELTGE